MTTFPDTRASLIVRIGDVADTAAWQQFVGLYRPIIYRLARRQGLQDADAEELVQEVLLAVSRGVGRWVPDDQRGRFRHWLLRITRNLKINFLTRPRHQPWGTGDSRVQAALAGQPARGASLSQIFEIEYRRTVFQFAAKSVQQAVSAKTWQAFWISTIDAVPIADVADRLRMSTGSVYIARNRVMARLKAEVERIEAIGAAGDEDQR